jgi:hypothetical protein
VSSLVYFAAVGAALGGLLSLIVTRGLARVPIGAVIGAVLMPVVVAALVALPGTFEYSAECGVVATAIVIFFVEGRGRRRR